MLVLLAIGMETKRLAWIANLSNFPFRFFIRQLVLHLFHDLPFMAGKNQFQYDHQK